MRFVFAAAILAGVGLSQWSQARAEQVVLVELFTSQGCSSCPPADAHFGELAQQDNVVALAFHVDYWDYLGWSDTFADPAFADRQRTYAPRVDRSHIGRALRGSFTPEMVVQGTESLIGSMRKTVGSRVAAHAAGMPKARLDLSRVGGGIRVDVDTSGRPAKAARVMLARYTAEASVDIKRGENAGRTFAYHNVVRELTQIGRWDGTGPASFEAADDGQPVAVFLQTGTAGPVLAAASLK